MANIESGFPSHIAERCLNHKLKGVEDIYNRHDYLDVRRAALNEWASFLKCCESDKDWNVITPIKKKLGIPVIPPKRTEMCQ